MISAVDHCIVKWLLYTHFMLRTYFDLLTPLDVQSAHCGLPKTPVYSLVKRVLFLLCLVPGAAVASNAIETVTLQLKWQHQFQFAGYYAALEKGFYRDVGLSVKIQAHGPGLKSPIDQVLSGTAQYGITDSSLVKYRLDGKPVVTLAAIFQKSPVVWLVRQDSDIHGPHDFVGKRVMHMPGIHSSLFAMLQVEGIPASEINLIPTSFDLQDLINGHTDAFNSYSTNEPYILREQGIPYRIISPRNYGIDFYGDVLFTSESEIAQHPERTKAFRLASLKGWQYAMDHPDEIINLISTKYASNKSLAHLKFEAEAMRELIMPGLISIGHINPGRWNVIAELLVSLGFAESNYDFLEGYIYDPSPKPQNLKPFYVVIVSITLLTLVFMGLAIWIGRLNNRLKKSEHHYRRFFEQAPQPYQSLDEDGNILEVNSAWIRMLGYEENHRFDGKWFGNFLAPSFQAKFKENFLDFKAAGEIHGVQFKLLTKDKECIDVEIDGKVVRDDEGNFLQTHCLFTNITERKQAEKEKEELQKQLQQAQKMESIGQLTGGIAHDFNNMLAAIIGFSHLAISRVAAEPESKLNQYLYQILHAGERGRDMVAKMLMFGSARQGKPELVKATSLVQDVISLLGSTIPSSINLEMHLENSAPLLLVDSGQLHQVITNLVINARDAVDEHGHIDIRVSGTSAMEGVCSSCHQKFSGEFIEISVHDDGHGIPDDQLDHVFEPFFTTKKVGKGSGMGLAMVHGILHKCQGHILLESETDAGTIFRLLLPHAIEKIPAAGESEDTYPIVADARKLIMVVDDEASVAMYLSELLGGLGFDVCSFIDPLAALARFESNPNAIDLVITDQTMPALTGVEFAQKLLTIRPSLPVIMCTGYSETFTEENVKRFGIAAFLNKPVSPGQLTRCIARLLNAADNSENQTKRIQGFLHDNSNSVVEKRTENSATLSG